MDEQTSRMIQQLKSNPAMLQALMQSRDGQALLQMLSGGDRGASLQRAAQSAARGDPAEMVRMVNRLMQSPDGAALVAQLREARGLTETPAWTIAYYPAEGPVGLIEFVMESQETPVSEENEENLAEES